METPLHEQISDLEFRRAVELLDSGETSELKTYLGNCPELLDRRAEFPEWKYFKHPKLLEFVAENPIRRGTLPANIVEVTRVILEAGAKNDKQSVTEALMLVSSGRVARECHVQSELIHLLCEYGGNADTAMAPALAHAEFEAVDALLQHGAVRTIWVAAARGDAESVGRNLAASSEEDRHRALALAAQFGQVEVLKLLLKSGENPSRFNPPGFHSHSTPLHQAVASRKSEAVKILVEQGADLLARDKIWDGTPVDWAHHLQLPVIEEYLAERSRLGHG